MNELLNHNVKSRFYSNLLRNKNALTKLMAIDLQLNAVLNDTFVPSFVSSIDRILVSNQECVDVL